MNHIAFFPLLKWARMNDIRTGLINIVLFIKQREANPIESKSFSAWGSLNIIWWSKGLKAAKLVFGCVSVGEELSVYSNRYYVCRSISFEYLSCSRVLAVRKRGGR